MSKTEHGHHLIPVIPFEDSVMSYGIGSYLYDINGKKYLDLNAGQFCTILGHAHPVVSECIYQNVKKLSHTATNIISEDVVTCSNNIHRISGDMKASCILLSTGAEVVEFCLRYAKSIQGKNGVVCFDKGYHGLTLGAQSVTFAGKHAKPFVHETYSIPVPVHSDMENSIAGLETLFTEYEIAAIILEPIVSVGGMLFPSAEWFRKVRTLCDKHQILMVLDECQTGFGRTGNWFAYQTYGFVPDMVATAKGIGLGLPVAVAMFRDTLNPSERAYSITHYSSHQNDPFCAAIINTGITFIEENGILQKVLETAICFLSRLDELVHKNRHIEKARGCGLILGADLAYDNVDDYRGIYRRIYNRMMDMGVIIQGTNGGRTLRFLPDYLIKQSDIDFAMNALDEALLIEA